MKKKTFSITFQFIVGIAMVLSVVLLLATETYNKFLSLNNNIEFLHNHSLKERNHIGDLQVNFQLMRLHTRDVMLAKNPEEMSEAVAAIDLAASNAEISFDALRQTYTGDMKDVEKLYSAFVKWNSTRKKNIQLAQDGNLSKFTVSVSPEGEVGKLRTDMLNSLESMSQKSFISSQQQYAYSQDIKQKVKHNFAILIIIILCVVFVDAYFLFRNIQFPVQKMINTIHEYKNGNIKVRNEQTISTEMNVLSSTFNELFDHLDEEQFLQKNYAQLSTLMLSEIDAHKFFNNLLNYLMNTIGTQIGAVYVLSRDKTHYYLYESIGMKSNKIDYKFGAQTREGEFGQVLISKQISYLKNLEHDTRFIFQTSAGDIIPRELINIPIVIAGEVAAIITMASVHNIDRKSEKLLEKSFDVLTARVDGVLSYRRMRKFAEEIETKNNQLADSSAYNRALIEASIDPMLTIDKNGIVTDVNESLCKITVCESSALIGKPFHTLFEDSAAANISYKQAFEKEMVFNNENELIGRENVPVMFNASVYRNASAEVKGVFVALRDITEAKNREIDLRNLNKELTDNEQLITMKNAKLHNQWKELEQQNAELEMQKQQLMEANHLKTVFLSNMSHELRTPLNSVIALSGVLNRRLQGKIPMDEYSYIEVIQRNGRHLLSLINDILDLARIESGREEMEISTFDINDLVSEMHTLIAAQASEKDLQFEKILLHKSLQIVTDFGKCHHILQNLLGNAIKFTDSGKVSIAVIEHEHHVSIAVTDTGIGIAQENLKHIFDEFRQADGSTTRRFGGTGLGLSIAKKYAEALNGTIEIESELNKGSTFTLNLPKKISNSPSIARNKPNAQQESSHGNRLTNKTILLVEDSDPAIVQIKFFLEELNCHVMVARNGNEALALLDNQLPDAMILDLMMPQMDGFELLELVRNNPTTMEVPVLVLTAKHITSAELKQLKANNIHQLIQKGDVNKTELINALTNMMPIPERMVEQSEVINNHCQPPTGENSSTILIVEDNHDNMLTVKAVLSGNFKTLEAYDGREAIAMAIKHKPDLILMDIALPEIDGIEAFKAIRNDARTKKIPVVALTASALTSEKETILSYGFDAYLSKPIDEKDFCKTIKSIMYGI